MKRVVTSFVSNCYQLLLPAVALHCSSVTFNNEGMLFLIESTDNGKYRLLHSQTPYFKGTWLCDNSRNGINLAIPGSDGQTKNFFWCVIDYFRIPHNTLCLPPKFCISYCLQMLLGKCSTPRSISKQWFMQNLGGKQSVLWGIRK